MGRDFSVAIAVASFLPLLNADQRLIADLGFVPGQPVDAGWLLAECAALLAAELVVDLLCLRSEVAAGIPVAEAWARRPKRAALHLLAWLLCAYTGFVISVFREPTGCGELPPFDGAGVQRYPFCEACDVAYDMQRHLCDALAAAGGNATAAL